MKVGEKIEARFGGYAYAVNTVRYPYKDHELEECRKKEVKETVAVCSLASTARRIAEGIEGAVVEQVERVIVGGDGSVGSWGARYYKIAPTIENESEERAAARAKKLACLLCGDVADQELAEHAKTISYSNLTEEDDALVEKAHEMIRKGPES